VTARLAGDKISPRASVVYFGSWSTPYSKRAGSYLAQDEAAFRSFERARAALDALDLPADARCHVTVWRDRTNQRDALGRKWPGEPWQFLDRLLGDWMPLNPPREIPS